MTTMKAMRIKDYGGPEVLICEELDRPVPKEDELLIRVHAIGINPVDWKLREGYVRKMMELPMPAILGADISGVVEQAGSAVNGFKAGDEVYSMLGLMGAYAEYVSVSASLVALKPNELNHAEAASVPLAALTAWQALFESGKLESGQSVLVHAAAGGVGGFAVQFAKEKGARVIGTASPNNTDYLLELGADQVIDYHSERFEEKLGGIDVVLDLIGGEIAERSVSVLKSGGILVQVVPGTESLPDMAAAAQVQAIPMRVRPDGAQLREIAALVDSGKVTTSIAAVFPLTDVGQAHGMSKQGHTRGKIVLQCEV